MLFKYDFVLCCSMLQVTQVPIDRVHGWRINISFHNRDSSTISHFSTRQSRKYFAHICLKHSRTQLLLWHVNFAMQLYHKLCKFAFPRSLGQWGVNFLVNSVDQCAKSAHILRGVIFFILIWSHEMPAFFDEITLPTE